jgi:DNA polymerase/3'-5' exonuclease PolX
MEHQQAKQLAEHWKTLLAPACERIEIAGSLRRGKPEVKDIDLVCIPKIEVQLDLFGQPGTQINYLEALLPQVVIAQGALTVINGPRQKKIRLQEGIKLELWCVLPPAQWGAIFLMRTGPEDFAHWIVTQRNIGGGLPSNMKEKSGALWRHGKIIETPEESDFFREVGQDYAEPDKRRAMWRRMVEA